MAITRPRRDIAHLMRETKQNNRYDDRGFVPPSELRKIITDDLTRGVSRSFRQPACNVVKVTATLLSILTNSDKTVKACLCRMLDSGLDDSYLPVTYDPETTQIASGEGRRRRIFITGLEEYQRSRFVENQWHFHLPEFGDIDETGVREQRWLDPSTILPVVYCAPDAHAGAYGQVYQIRMHHEYLKIRPAPTEKNNPMLALKRLTVLDAEKAYRQEEAALLRINRLNHKHLVKLIDSFKRGRDYFFLFPWAAGGDLFGLWRKYDIGSDHENRSDEMKRWLLIQTRGIVSAIEAIHNLPDTAHGSEENGRHGDIRPHNILLFYDSESGHPSSCSEDRYPWSEGAGGTLRVADVGLARFHEKVTDNRQGPTDTTGAFLEYAPPSTSQARYDGTKPPRSRSYDIWTLGCLFHDLIVWVLFGAAEVERLHYARRSDGSLSSQFYWWNISSQSYTMNPVVEESIEKIRLALHRFGGNSDKWLEELVDIVEKDLLQINEAKRITSLDLDNKLLDMLARAGCDIDAAYLCSSTADNGGEDDTAAILTMRNLNSSSSNVKTKKKNKHPRGGVSNWFRRHQSGS
ncbi:kinase-like domain-containing protein [Rhypophila decipiens]|uniref:Kinase-like domain-containing protein n=1 Tax=Rhypophila decipiens TaxID=261697 RepID=A0AAN6Y4B9_9PEZI|nr:kinase-like domain-containing protein [Rhypophila decipiens]